MEAESGGILYLQPFVCCEVTEGSPFAVSGRRRGVFFAREREVTQFSLQDGEKSNIIMEKSCHVKCQQGLFPIFME